MSMENHEHSRFIYNSYYYDGHRLDPSDLDLKAYIDERIAASPGGSSYLVYTALLTHPGDTSAPTVVNEKNELGGTAVYAYVDEGNCSLTLTGRFPAGRTFAVASGTLDGTTTDGFALIRASNDQMDIKGSFLGDCVFTIMIFVFNE